MNIIMLETAESGIPYSSGKTKEERNWLDASFTAEAALLFPMIILIIFSVMYMCFYLYDDVRVITGIHEMAEKAIADGETDFADDAQKDEFVRKLKQQLTGAFLSEPFQIRAELKFGKLKIRVEMKRRGPAGVLRLTGRTSAAVYEAVKRRSDPAEFTRLTDILWEAGRLAAGKLSGNDT